MTSTRSELPAPTGSREQTACLVADFDRDSRDDVLVASRNAGGKIEVWLTSRGQWSGRNRDGSPFGRVLVEPDDVRPEAGGTVHDIDGDGDVDFVLGQDAGGDELYWWENPAPDFSRRWTRRRIAKNPGRKHHDQAIGDVDGDGRVELVSWNQGSRRILVYEIPADPRRAAAWPVTTAWTAPNSRHEGLEIADVDLDGKNEIVAAGRLLRFDGTRWQVEVIDSSMGFTRVAVGQLIEGGRPEIVFVPGDANGMAAYYDWDGQRWRRRDLEFVLHGHTLAIADVDRDGHEDLILGEMRLGRIACQLQLWYGDGRGNLRKTRIAQGNGIHEGRIADIDGDGNLDIVHKPYNDRSPRLDVWVNELPPIASMRAHELARLPERAIFVRHGDLDGDSRPDVVTGDAWYRNPGSPSGAWARRVVGTGFGNVAVVHDFDGDGDLDLLGTRGIGSRANSEMVWAENDGRGSFRVRGNIARARGDFLQGAVAARFGGRSAPLEVALSWHQAGMGVQMLTVPDDPKVGTWSWRVVSTASLDEDLSAGDVDGDGDLDLLLGTHWLEAPAWTMHQLGRVDDLTGVGGRPMPDRNEAIDFDGDGDLDLVVSLENGIDVVGFENPGRDRVRGPWRRRLLGRAENQAFSLDAADLDDDGDVDVIAGEHRGSIENRLLVFENRGGGVWVRRTALAQPRSVADHHDGTRLVDLDGDGDLDVVSIGWTHPKLWAYENLANRGGSRRARDPVVESFATVFDVERVVQLGSPEAASTIHYTLDGSEPTTSSPRYQSPIEVSRTVALRARAFAPGLLPSAIVESTYARLLPAFAQWRFDAALGDATPDEGSGARQAQLLAGAKLGPGRLDSALELDGVDARAVVKRGLAIASGELGVALWFRARRFDHLASHDARMISVATGVQEYEHQVMVSTIRVGAETRLRGRLAIDGKTVTLIGDRAVQVGRWHHAALNFDGSTVRLLLDGRETARLARSGNVAVPRSIPCWIGNQPPAGNRPFDGWIDELRVSARAFSERELAAMSKNAAMPGVERIGFSTPGCRGAVDLALAQVPRVGDRVLRCASSGAPAETWGVLLLSPKGLPGGIVAGGVTLYMELQVELIFALRSLADGTATASPVLPRLAPDMALYAQALFVPTTRCRASAVLTASQALRVRLQPK